MGRRWSSIARRRSGASCARTARPRRARSSSTGPRRSRTSRCSSCSRKREPGPTSPRSESSLSRGPQTWPASRSSSTATTSRTRKCARLRRSAHSSCSTGRARRKRPAAAGGRRVLVRLTPGVEAVTHRSIQTAHEESKFGLAPAAAEREIERARELGLEVEGVHVHVGSQLGRPDESVLALERVLGFLERLDWTPRLLDLGGGLGVRHNRDERLPSVAEFVGPLVARVPDGVSLILEPDRALVGRAGVTLYRVGSVKESGGITYAAIDGG